MEVKTYNAGHDNVNNVWYISFELQNGAHYDQWEFSTEMECTVMVQLLQCQDSLSLTEVNGILVLEGINKTHQASMNLN